MENVQAALKKNSGNSNIYSILVYTLYIKNKIFMNINSLKYCIQNIFKKNNI